MISLAQCCGLKLASFFSAQSECTHLVCLSNVHNLLVYFFYQDLNPRVRKEHQKKFLNYLFGSLQSPLLPKHADLPKDVSAHSLQSRKKENI